MDEYTSEEGYQEALRRIQEVKEKGLHELDLNSLRLTSLPGELWDLKQLKLLNLGDNQLSNLPASISKLKHLLHLNIFSNRFTQISKNISKLVDLKTLTALNNSISFLDESIGNLRQLQKLDLGGNLLSTLPDSLERLVNLEILYIDQNEFKLFPTVIVELTKLDSLWMNSNQIKRLPNSIRKLTNLRTLIIANNELISLPKSMKDLTNLELIELHDNEFEIGSEILELPAQEQVREILKWQKAQKEGTLRPIREAKVIFMGESNYGKTNLIEWLKENKISRKDITTTHGIERSKIDIPFEDKEIRVNIWDLGGQEFMRSTHQFFFSERTLYVLVTLARRERNELNHWLKLANQLGKGAPVLVVINKVDLDPHDLDRKSLERDYPNIVGFVRTSIKNCKEGKATDTLKNLKEKITRIIGDKELMPSVFEERPPDWFTVKEELEKLEENGKDFITYNEYEKLEFIQKLPEEDRKSNLKLLSMIGAVVIYVDDPRLLDTNVINPQWIMDGVYSIINDPIVKDKRKGELHISDLNDILDDKKFPQERHAYLLELMKKFDLCYEAREKKNVYFIPDLFEDVEPDFEWDNTQNQVIRFRYNYDDFSPDAFMTRFIVEMHQDILEDKRWRSGVYISNGDCSAKVYQSFRKNFIHVEVIGREARSYLYAIRDAFRRLHQNFEQLNITQEVFYKDYWVDYLKLINREKKNKPWYHDELDEDLPITTILNGYSTPIDRTGTQKHIKVFLASSDELKEERQQFEIFIHRENKQLYKRGIFIELELWEDGIEYMDQERLQNRYNQIVKHSDLFVCLFFTKVGKYTSEEFATAFGQFKETGKPLIYTYFKDADIKAGKLNRKDAQSLFDFQDKLDELKHFYSKYENVADLQLQFKRQLEKILPDL